MQINQYGHAKEQQEDVEDGRLVTSGEGAITADIDNAMQHDKRQTKLQLKDILPTAIVATGFGAFGAVFIAHREWVPGLITLGVALILIVSLVVRAWCPQIATPTERPEQQRPLVETNPLLVVLFGFPFAIVALALAASGEWLAALIPASLCLLLLMAVGAEMASRRLGREMRSLEAAEESAPSSEPVQSTPAATPLSALPVPPFAVTIFDEDNIPPISQATQAFVERRRQIFNESGRIYRCGAEFLWCVLVGFLVSGLLLTSSVPPGVGPFVWWCRFSQRAHSRPTILSMKSTLRQERHHDEARALDRNR